MTQLLAFKLSIKHHLDNRWLWVYHQRRPVKKKRKEKKSKGEITLTQSTTCMHEKKPQHWILQSYNIETMIYHLISKSMYQADVLSAYYIFSILMGQDKPHFMFWYFFLGFFFCLKITLFVIFRAKTKKLNKKSLIFKFKKKKNNIR